MRSPTSGRFPTPQTDPCTTLAQVLFLDDDTIRTWYRLYQQDGFDGLVSFGYDGE